MIVSFRDEWLRAFFVEDVHAKHIPPDLETRLFRKLQMIDDAVTDSDLRVPPSNHFEKLRGALDPRQPAVAADLRLGRPSRRSPRPLSRRPQLSIGGPC